MSRSLHGRKRTTAARCPPMRPAPLLGSLRVYRARAAMTTANQSPDGAGTAGEARTAGIVLVATTLLSILMMAHHPSAATHDPASLAADIAGSATLSRVVHGSLIAMIGLELY